MKPFTRLAALLALAAAAAAVNPAGATAQTTAPYIVEPITTDFGAPSIGNGVIAWAYSSVDSTKVWTLRDGKPVLAAKLPSLLEFQGLEAGTDEHGKPVVIVTDYDRPKKRARVYLVHLDSGDVRRLGVPHSGQVQSVAIDSGRVLYALTSSLWSARLNGSALTERTRLRRSPRGTYYDTVVADRRRIAVTGRRYLGETSDPEFLLPLYAGTAHGTWRKVATGEESPGGYTEAEAAGFSRDGRSVIVTDTSSDQLSFHVRRISLRTGRVRRIKLQNAPACCEEFGIQAAYEPDSNRLLASSGFVDDDSDGLLGWSSVLK